MKTIHKRKDKAKKMLTCEKQENVEKSEVDSNTDKEVNAKRKLERIEIKYESLILAQDERWRRA